MSGNIQVKVELLASVLISYIIVFTNIVLLETCLLTYNPVSNRLKEGVNSMKKEEFSSTPTVLPDYFRDAYLALFPLPALQRLETVMTLRSTSLQTTNVLNTWLESTAGTPARFQALALLWAADRLVPHQEIITLLQVKRATVSALMYALEQEGLVRSIGDQKDRRRLLATITDEGKKVVINAMQVNRVRLEKAFAYAGFSSEELVMFRSLLSRARDGFLQAASEETDA
jgi:DNA-binding MarR family transcriptional regulator